MVVNNVVLASDQADYLAPYITFEDGKLVTKDPMKEQTAAQPGLHATNDTGNAEITLSEPASGTTDHTVTLQEASVDEPVSVRYIVMTGSAVILLIATFFYYKMKSRQGNQESHSV